MAIIFDFKTGQVIDYTQHHHIRIYDQDAVRERLMARFGDNVDRIIKNPITKTKGGIEFLDTYGHGNVHNSKWQWLPKSKAKWNRPMPFPCDINAIEYAIRDKTSQLMLGYKSDPFMWMDVKYGVTKETLRLAAKYRRPLLINTMSDLIAHDDYIEILKICVLDYVVMNMGSGDIDQERIDSPGAPSIKRRYKAAQKLHDAGIRVYYNVKGKIQFHFKIKGGAA